MNVKVQCFDPSYRIQQLVILIFSLIVLLAMIKGPRLTWILHSHCQRTHTQQH
jgi:hypothetical protein